MRTTSSSRLMEWESINERHNEDDRMESGFRQHPLSNTAPIECPKDGRLFPEYTLYCEGSPKPALRGVLHGIACMWLVFFGMDLIVGAAHDDPIAAIMGSVYVFTNILCYGISAVYHMGSWNVSTEIFLQKADHCGIAIFSAGTMIPVSYTLLPLVHPLLGYALGLFAVGLAVWVCFNVVKLRPSVFKQVAAAASIVPFIPFLYPVMTSFEWFGMLGCIISQMLGVLVFVNGWPDPLPSVFGHHEIFHVFVTMAGGFAYATNLSMMERICGGGSSGSSDGGIVLDSNGMIVT
jgi:hemolysin III